MTDCIVAMSSRESGFPTSVLSRGNVVRPPVDILYRGIGPPVVALGSLFDALCVVFLALVAVHGPERSRSTQGTAQGMSAIDEMS